MEENAYKAIVIAINVFIFMYAVSSGIMLMGSVNEFTQISYEKIQTLNVPVLEQSGVPDTSIIKGSEIIIESELGKQIYINNKEATKSDVLSVNANVKYKKSYIVINGIAVCNYVKI